VRLVGWLALSLCGAILIVSGAQYAASRLGLSGAGDVIGTVLGTLLVHGGILAVILALRPSGPSSVKPAGTLAGLGIRSERAGLAVRAGVVAALLMLPVAWMLGQVTVLVVETAGFTAPPQVAVERLRDSGSIGLKFYIAAFAVLLAPLVEEVLFRGVLYPGVKAMGRPRLALWGTSLVFGFIHFNLMTFVPLVVFALVLARLYEQTGNLLAPIAAHATFNAANVVALFLVPELPPLP